MRIFRYLIALSLVFTGLSPLEASFQIQSHSARAAGMGNAFTAASDEPGAMFINPAGIAKIPTAEASFMYGKPYADLPDVNFNLGDAALVLPVRWGRLGLGMFMFNAQGLKVERTMALSYAFTLARRFQFGVNLKHLYHAYDIASDPIASKDPLFQKGTSRSAFAVDLGLVTPVAPFLKLGASVRNVNRPDVGLVVEDRVPREVQLGLSMDMPSMGMQVTGDLLQRENAMGNMKGAAIPHLGLEKFIQGDMFCFRLGVNTLEFAAGFGIKMKNIGFDYALVLNRNLMQDNFGSHKVGLTYRFGRGVMDFSGRKKR